MSASLESLSLQPKQEQDNPLIPANKLIEALLQERHYIYEAISSPTLGSDTEDPSLVESLDDDQPEMIPDKKLNYTEVAREKFAEYLRDHYTAASIPFMHTFKQLAYKAITQGTEDARWDLLEFLFHSGYSNEDAKVILGEMQKFLPGCGSEWLQQLSTQDTEVKSKNENEKLFQCILHKTPVTRADGDHSYPVHIEIMSKLSHLQLIQEIYKISGVPFSSSISFYDTSSLIAHIVKNHIKLIKENKQIVQTYEDMNIFVQWDCDSQDLSKGTFFALDNLVNTASRSDQKTADFFLQHYRFHKNNLLGYMRSAMRNGNPKLLETILMKLASDMSWEINFTLMVETGYDYDDGFLMSRRDDPGFNLSQQLEENRERRGECISDSPLSYALRMRDNLGLIQTLLKYGAQTVVKSYGHRIDVTDEISKIVKEQEQRKTMFLLAFNASVGQDSAVFKEFVQSPIAAPRQLTRLIFDFI